MLTVILISWGALILSNPYLLAAMFVQFLLVMSILMSSYCKFLAYILFLVYIGGIMILISYCVMLSPANKFWSTPLFMLSGLAIVLFIKQDIIQISSNYAYGLLYSNNAILLIALVLYLVLVAIVEIVNYGSGMIKF